MVSLLQTMLTSNDYRSVDEPLFSAVSLFEQRHGQDAVLPDFVLPAFRKVMSYPSLNLKRALWLILIRMCPPIEEYVGASEPNPERARLFLAWLAEEVERLFNGSYSAFPRPLDEFVSSAQVAFNSF